MLAASVPPVVPYLQSGPDPRQASGRRHPLAAILALRCAAMVAGCDRLLAMAEWGRDPYAGALLAQQLGFTRARTPCVATRHRVFRRLDVAAFERAVSAWAHEVITALPGEHAREALAIDGQTLRGSRQPMVPAVQLLGALGHQVGLVLTQTPIAAGADEVGALPALWADLILEGRGVTVDAACTERPVAATIRATGGPS